MKVMLANDTGVVNHVGCQGVSDAHARMLGRAGHRVTRRFFIGELGRFRSRDPEAGLRLVLRDEAFMAQLHEVDALVVNGEGTIHHGAGTEYLNILGAAARIGKKTLLVNCVLEAIEGFDSIFGMIDDIVVRDHRSAAWLRSRGGESRVVPDSFIEAQFSSEPLLDLDGRIAVTDWHHARDKDVGAASIAFMRRRTEAQAFFFPLMSGDVAPFWRRAPATLARARYVVTGRHHGVYAALLADVPFVALSSNTYKIAGLLDAFPDLRFCLDPVSIDEALAQAAREGEVYRGMREAILGARPLTTFRSLGGAADPDGERRECERLQDDIMRRAALRDDDLVYRMRRRSRETCADGAV